MSSNSTFNENIEYLERVTTNLHESVMKVRMVPIESVVNRFPRMIRDLNRKLNKKMELYMTGEDTELDRTVIDELGDPLMHLLRNSADHGLESNEERVRLGKPEVGSIYLDAYQDGNNVTIEVRDDGAGINIEKVKSKAIEKGTITEQQAETMTEKDFIDLLFRPSFSTADKISDVSGRGVGLDVVKTKIESLGGSIEAKTVKGEGSTFTIQLPLTLAIIQALMVEVGKEKYAIPLGNIDTIEDISLDEIKLVQSKEVIHLRGSVIPIVRMNEVLEMEDYEHDSESKSMVVVVVKKGDAKMDAMTNETVTEEIQYIVIRLGEEQYGINIGYVDNIVRMPRVTRVPKSQPYYIGVINLRGEVVPVMSLRKRFGLEADEYTGATRIIILKLKDQSMIGVIVDEVKEVVNLDPETIEKPNFKLDESNASYLTGIGKSGENLISLLNIENVVGETKTA